jgi:hypothetical protein
MQSFTELPSVGAWRLLGAYEGHEVVRFTTNDEGIVIEGTTVGVEEGLPWSIHYGIKLNLNWNVIHAIVTDYAGGQVEIQTDAAGSWMVNGEHRPELDGCLDLDLEASVVTNTLPVHRLNLAVGRQGDSAAAYVRTNGLLLERLDQTYRRLPDSGGKLVFDYESPRFGYRDTLHFGTDGLAVDYPGIGVRVGLQV